MAGIYGTTAIEDNRRRLEEEAARLAQEAAERRAAEQAEKATEEAAKATTEQAQTAAPEQPKQQTQIDPANVNIPDPAHTGVRSKGLPKVRQEDIDKTKFLGDVRTSTLDTQFGVVGENYVAPEYKDFMSKEDQIEHYASRMAYHAAGMGGEGERGPGNTVNVNRESFKDAKQAVLFSTTMSDAKNQYKLLTDYAEDIGVDPNAFVAEAEKWMKNTYNRDLFSVPQTDSGKIQAANKALGGIGLTDIGGNSLDIANTTPQLVIQSLRMNPDPAVHDEAYKAIQILQKTQGSKWYGMDLKKDDFGFLDSADLTQSQYNEQAKAFASRFVYADSDNDRNKTAYLSSVQEINAKYGSNKRVHAQMMSLLNKTFEERNPGVAAPDAAAVDAFLEKQAAAMANDPAAKDDPNWLEKLKGAWDGIFGKKEEPDETDSTLDAIIEQTSKDEQEAMDGMLTIGEDGKTTYHGATGDVVIGNATVAPEATEPEVQGPQLPASKTASGSNNLASAANAGRIGGLEIPEPIAVLASAGTSSGVNFLPGAKNVGEPEVYGPHIPEGVKPTAVDQMLAADQPSVVADQSATVAYDPNMSDEAAMLAHSRGQTLDPKNYAQIKSFVEDEEWLRVYRACQRGYANTDMYGDSLYDYEKSTVNNRTVWGDRIGAATMGLRTEGLDPEIKTLGSMMIANLVKDMNATISDPYGGFTQILPNQYDSMIAQNKEFSDQLKEIEGLWAKQIEAEQAVNLENKQENQAMAEAYTQQAIEGTITADGIAWLAVNEDEEATENIRYAAMEDDGYISAIRNVKGSKLFGGGGFWEDEEFWKGNSAVATEMRNVEAIGGKKAAKDYKKLLGGVMEDTYLSLSIDAHQAGKTMDEYLGMVEMTAGDVADLSLMKMISSGMYVLNHPEAQQALDTISIGRWNAAALGLESGVKKTGESAAEGAQIIATESNRDRYAFEIYNKFNSEFAPEFAPREVRKALIEFANSGALSEESKAELMYELEHGDDIYNVAAGYMEHDGFTAYLDNAVNKVQKDLETIDVLIASLPEDERSVANAMKSASNTLSSMAVSYTLGLATGNPFLGAFGQNALGWADRTEYFRTKKGATRGSAAFNSTMQTLALSAVNTMGVADWMDDMFGAKGYYNVLKRAAIKNPGTFVQNLGTATKYGLKSGAQAFVTEGFEGGVETVVEGGYEMLYDTVKAENEAINRGEGASFFRPLMNFTSAIAATDPLEAGKEFLAAAGAEGAMGAIMRVATNIITTPFAIGGANRTKQFKSTGMALRMYDGELPMTVENIGKFVQAFKQDSQNPAFVGYMNKVNQYTQDQKNITMAILDGAAEPERKAAVTLAEQAEIYHKDAEAARTAADETKGTYVDLRSRVIDGEVELVPQLKEARDKWTKAETAFKEADGAWQKTAKEATEKASLWYSAVRQASTGIKSQEIGLLATRMLDAQKLLAQQIVVKTEAEMQAEAEAEAAIAAEADVVDVMTDEELDADIAQMLESENAVANAEAESEEMGYDEETLNALAEQAEADKQKNSAHKEAIIRNQRNSYESLTARMQQAQELEDTDAYNALGEQRGAVQARLEALGVTLDQETNAPEPTTDTAPARPNAKAPVAPKATTESVSPEPSTTTPAAKPASDPAATKAARYESAKDLLTGTTKEQRDAVAAEAREAANVSAMDVEAYIAARHPNASDAEKQHIRDIYNEGNASNQPAPPPAPSATPSDKKLEASNAIKFAGQVKRRFGVKVEIVPPTHEKLALKSGKSAAASYDRDTDTIYVSSNATQGDVIRAKVVHELTHRTENTGAYKEFSQAVLSAYFNGNTKNEESMRNKIQSLYKKNGVELTPDALEHELVAYATEKLIGGDQDMVNRIVNDSPSVARRILDAIKNVLSKMTGVKAEEVDQLKAVEKMFQKALNEAKTQKRTFGPDRIEYSIRESDPPKKVVYAYKAFYAKDGKLYPPMVANITDDADKQKVKNATSGTMKSLPTPVGVWLDADIGGIMVDDTGKPVRSKDTKRLRVKNDKSGGSATLAFRPGWHLGEWPDAKQFNKADPDTGERGKRMPDDLVFAKCEVSADVDYQLDALSYGLSDKGSFSRSQAGLPYVPDDGYYKYRTNVDPTTAPWLIAGSIKVVEILDDEDCARICAEYGVTPDKRYSGKPIDLSEYGLKRGPVEETTEGMERFKENEANRANKALLESALNDPEYADAYVQREIDFDNPKQYAQLQKEFVMNGQDIEEYRKLYDERGFASEKRAKPDAVSPETGEPLTGTVGGDTVVQYSLSSWTPEEEQTVRSNLVSKGYDEDAVDNWIDDVNSVAAIVAADRDRLDFEAADNQVMLKPNQEYVKTLDASTLCAKRILYQGTFNAIQHILNDRVLTSDDLIRLRNMMADMGYETPCGICYVESRRRNLGVFAKKWLDGYDAKGGYQPKLDDVTTTDGLERMLHEHPEVYQSFLAEMNRKGSNNPKVVQLRTDYRGDIRSLTESQVQKILDIGGLRVQSFSDFETPHLLDMMQATLDMTEKSLTSQAYTKVPNFAWVFGDTGIKINLSLIGEGNGLDENGNLIFSSYEGMDFDEAMRLRDRYSKNVGTILVGMNDAHIRAAMADPRIDYIIPFHKSGWGKKQLNQLTGMREYKDYTKFQNERVQTGTYKNGNPKGKNVKENFHPVGPSGYWDFGKSGNENAATYLRMCEEDGRIPKFNQFLTKDADGHWVTPDGYWKLLIDFKMYDNDGVGAPQMPVQPSFNMEEARRVLSEYEGGANELPVAHDVVEKFVAETRGKNSVQYAVDGIEDVQHSIDEPTLPDDDFLREEIEAWKNDTSYSVDDAPAARTGERQFATQTIQQNEYVPDYIKQTFLNDPTRREYSRESNMGQLTRAWNRVQKEGYEGVRDRLLNQEGKFDADDNADALVLMSTAMQYDDMDTFMSVATKYNAEGTEQAQALQIRSLMKKMTPTGFAQKVVKDAGRKLEAHMETHKAESRNIARQSKKIEDSLHLRDLDGTSATDRLLQGESVRIDNKWGAPLNEQKEALIKEFGLGKVARPGVFYNWATTKQRMLEDILTTDDVFARDSNGMNLVDRLIRMKHGHPVVTKADIAYITEQMNIFNSLDDKSSREADLALSRAYEAQGNITPASGKEKRRTWRYTSMLLSLASATRNVIGNTAQSIPNAIADGIAVELDRAISLATGRERTRAHISFADRIEGWHAFTQETKNTFRDYFIDKTITQHGEGRYNQNQRGRVFETQALEALRNMEGLLMSVGDRNFWKKKFINSLAEQQRIAEANGMEFDIDEATEIAEAEANYATFNEDNAVRSAFTSLKNAPIIGPVLDYIMPFTGVPTNIVKRQIEFSPIGLAYTAFKHGMGALNGNDFDQRAFVNGMARGLTGSALMMVGAELFKQGVLKLGTKEEDDDKLYNLRTAQGDQYGVYFTIGDKNYSISTFSPAASAFVAGAFVADALGDNERWYQAVFNGTLKNVNDILDASYMSALSDLLNTTNGQNVVDNFIPTVGNSLLTQNIPAPVSHLASSIDPYVRDTKDKDALMAVVKTTMSKIPGLREMLPEKNDITGTAIENTKYGAAAFLDPFTTTAVNDDPALKELERIQEATGSSSHIPTFLIKNSGKQTILAAIADEWNVNMDRAKGEQNLVLNADERNHYNQLYGDLAFNGTGDKYYRTVGKGVEGSFTGIRDYMNSYAYQYATDEERAKEIEKINKKAKLLTQSQIVIDKGYATYY